MRRTGRASETPPRRTAKTTTYGRCWNVVRILWGRCAAVKQAVGPSAPRRPRRRGSATRTRVDGRNLGTFLSRRSRSRRDRAGRASTARPTRREDRRVPNSHARPHLLAGSSILVQSTGFPQALWTTIVDEFTPLTASGALSSLSPRLGRQVGNDETAARDRSFFDSPVTWKGRAARATGPGVSRGSRTPENFQLRRACRCLPKSSTGGRQSVFRMQRKPQGSCGSLVDPPVLGLFEDPGAPARSVMVRPDAEGSSARGEKRGRKPS